MTHKRDIESIVRRRIEKKINEEPPEPPKNTPLDDLDSGEWVDEDKQVKKAERAKRKRLNGYMNKNGRSKGGKA